MGAASALEGLARANAAAGRKDERDAYFTAATQALRDIDDPQDRDLIASQLSTVPEIEPPRGQRPDDRCRSPGQPGR